MDEVVSIAPLAGEPGLIAYECPSCGYVTSVLFHPDGANSRAFLYRRPSSSLQAAVSPSSSVPRLSGLR